MNAEIPGAVPLDPKEASQAVTFKLSDEAVKALTGLAILDDSTLADQLRGALSAYTERRLADPDLEARALARQSHKPSE